MSIKNFLKQILPIKIRKQINRYLKWGNTYQCPFCNYSSSQMGVIGIDIPVLTEKQVIGGGLRLGGCMNCGSTDRERLIYAYLKEEIKVFNSGLIKDILHFAPEKNLTQEMLKFGFKNYVCGDLFADNYEYPEHVRNINILSIPFNDFSFDLVICNHVLEHIPNDLNAINELYRVLKIGGQAILQVPISKNSSKTYEDFSIIDPKEREHAFGQYDHVRIYGQDYTERLESCGFKVDRINISAKYNKYGLNQDEDLFICKK